MLPPLPTHFRSLPSLFPLRTALLLSPSATRAGENLDLDASIEKSNPKDLFGNVFEHWWGWA